MTDDRLLRASMVFVRVALAVAFISSIADRFGLWGPHGAATVAWGDWPHFVRFVALLNFYAPAQLVPAISVVDTVIEAVLAVALLLGLFVRFTALSSAVLLAIYTVTMALALGPETPLNYGVPTAVAAALLLGALAPGRTPAGAR